MRKLIILIIMAITMSLFVVPVSADNRPDKPSFSIKSGTYLVSPCSHKDTAMKLKISGKGTIFYKITTDDNAGKYKKYTGPISITQDSVVKAYCEVDGKKGKVATRKINRRPQLNVSHDSGMYEKGFTVKLTHPDCFCVQARETKIYYTLDGTKPTKNSKLYKDGIYIGKNRMLKIMVVSENGKSVSYDSFNYFVLRKSLLNNYKVKYHYNKLDSKGKKIYRKLFESANKGNYANFNLEYTIDEAWDAIDAFFCDNPQFFADRFVVRTKNDYVEQVVLTNNTDYPTLVKEVEKEICEMMGAPCKTEEEQIKKIHDILCNKIVYTDEENGCFDAAGAIIKGKAVCQGYAMAFSYLCQLYGINCSMVKGEVKTGPHGWNILNINDKWLYIDVCWDDSLNSYNYYLKTEKQMSKTHTLKKFQKEIYKG